MIWLQFIFCTAVILVAGARLSRYGDVIAEKTGMSRTWIGVVMMASVTSLPELITGVSSVALFDLPNIAAGDVLGSCMFNILILALLDLKPRSAPISSKAHQGHVLTAGYGILMLGLVTIGIVAGNRIPVVGWIGIYSLFFVFIYLGAMRMVFFYEKRRHNVVPDDATVKELLYPNVSRRRAFLMYAFFAVVIIATATWLPHIGEKIAASTGLGTTFVGSLFIALSTSLPELVIAYSALRIGAADMAVGNLFGSNLFNIGILALDDLFYTKGALLSNITQTHVITANAAMAMTAVMIIGLTYQTKRKFLYLAWDSFAVIWIYISAIWLLFALQ
ncbi:MAG: sodium:calcium antiporter [Pyrinomonadaceae bacterium]